MDQQARHLRDDGSEITLRGICLGAAITVVFVSANLYLGLKTGMTFSSSIPAAVISMGVLRLLGSGGVLENNIVQTQASAAGTLCNVILVVPGLLLARYWNGFPLWQTTGLCLLGGLFGVAYSVPLRRVMVVESDLPFPEGVAAAEVLASGHGGGAGDDGLKVLAAGGAVAAAFNLVTSGLRVLPDQLAGTVTCGHAAFRLGGGLSLALIGVGYLVRIGACLALLVGVILAWGVAVPVLTAIAPPAQDYGALAQTVWADKVRLIGAGIIAVGGLWTVATLVGPLVGAFRAAPRAAERAGAGRWRDLPPALVAGSLALLLVPTAALFASFVHGHHLTASPWALVLALVALTATFGFMMAAACGYMAGLLGSSSSPISGIGILSTMLVAVCSDAAFSGGADPDTMRFIVAMTLFITSLVVTISSIANDNLQDLKTGQIVGATPWKQQAALAVGVVVGALTIAPVLRLLYDAYGFADAYPRAGMDPGNAMPAPQAALMTQIADGIIHHRLAWPMVFIGAGLGAMFVAAEALLRRRGFSLPALTVGIGMYLPVTVVVTIALGGVIGWFAERAVARRHRSSASKAPSGQAEERVRRRGVLIASGFLVGESLVGILIAASDTVAGRSGSLAFRVDVTALPSAVAGPAVFLVLLGCFYWATSRGPLSVPS